MSCMNDEDVNDSFSKDPNAVLDYDCDWSSAKGPWLKDGDTIADVVWLVPDGLTQDEERSGHTDTKTTIWLSGGELGKSYDVITRITTVQGRVEDQTQTFFIEQH